MLQRCAEGEPEDWGIYVELNDQINSGYGLIRHCTIRRDRLELDLTRPLSGFSRLHVVLSVEDSTFDRSVAGVREIFRGNLHLLTLEV
jgi:hypothetical protein